jgi:hypothetical protein
MHPDSLLSSSGEESAERLQLVAKRRVDICTTSSTLTGDCGDDGVTVEEDEGVVRAMTTTIEEREPAVAEADPVTTSTSPLPPTPDNDTTLFNVVVAAIVQQLRQLDPELASLDEQQQLQQPVVVPPITMANNNNNNNKADTVKEMPTIAVPPAAVEEKEEQHLGNSSNNETNDKVSADWIHSLAVHMVTLLRQLDPELAKLDEEEASAASLPKELEDGQNNKLAKEQQLRDLEDALGELLARVGTDANSFVEQCRAHVQEHKLRLENTAKNAVSCHEYAVLPLIELLDPEPDIVPTRGDDNDDDDIRCIVSSAPRRPPLLLEPSEQSTTTTVVQPVVQNHFWQWNAGDVFNHHGGCGGDTTSLVHASASRMVQRSSSSPSDTARLETLKKDTRDWQANIASLTSILQQLPFSIRNGLSGNCSYLSTHTWIPMPPTKRPSKSNNSNNNCIPQSKRPD